jgi:two-component system, NtrC family, response regulator AtoC
MTPKILVVDDDEVLGQVLRRVLEGEGYTVFHATSATQALQLAQEVHPALALLDLCLPDGDGGELAQKLEAQFPALSVILMTAYPLRLRDDPQASRGFVRVLTKPLNLNELRQTIAAALSAPAAPGQRFAGLAAPQTLEVAVAPDPDCELFSSLRSMP